VRHTRSNCLLPHILIAEILRRLALNAAKIPGHSLRAIAREMNVNRDTVRAIDRGEYAQSQQGFDRCSVCGHAVLLPCRVCQARAA
jgi:hypothetical protein